MKLFKEIKLLHPDNLDWQKAKRWGNHILTENGYSFYQWKGRIYMFDDSINKSFNANAVDGTC